MVSDSEPRSAAPIYAGAVYLVGIGGLIATILWLNQGRFVYSLDDPYIHLAMAENVGHGHYGLNLDEPSSPSSSVAWPLLLALFSRLACFECVPLVICVLSILILVWTLARAMRSLLLPGLSEGAALMVLLILAAACNFWGMPLNGMEHSLQLLLTGWVALGIVSLVENDRVSRLLLVGLVLGPLIRFENYAFLLPGLWVLVVKGRRRHAAWVAVVSILLALGWLTFYAKQGLPLLPSSVMVKSEILAADWPGGTLYEIVENIGEGLGMGSNQVAAILLVILARSIRRDPDRARAERHRLYLFFALGAAGTHLIFGRYNWYGRYEVYIMLALSVVLLRAFADGLTRLIVNRRALPIGALVLVSLWVGGNQIWATITTPQSANNIYDTVFQMHRFTVDWWRDSVGVNDVGRVSFRNPHYVLDLWGLGSEEARLSRQHAVDNAWAERLLDDHQVDLLMVLEHWFSRGGELPENWEKVARLTASRPGVAAGTVVTFFLRNPSRNDELRQLFDSFSPTLPPGVTFEVFEIPSGHARPPT